MDPKRTLLVLILLMTIFEVRSQEELPDIIPPAPEASSIGKFSEVPVSHYTGVPNISIPIASYDLGDRSFPVSLKYHARGIKVAEIASRVGIGWALSAGGRITRQIRMKPDDLSSGDEGYLYGWGEIFDNYSDITPQNKISLLDELDAIDRDKLPDMYTLRTPELSTKFIFDYKDGEPIVQEYDDIKIDVEYSSGPSGSIEGFTVTDDKGYIYKFGISSFSGNVADRNNYDEKIIFNSGGYSNEWSPPEDARESEQWAIGSDHITTWHLTEAESPDGDIVRYLYDEESYVRYTKSSENEDASGYQVAVTKERSTQYQLSEIQFDFNGQGDYSRIEIISSDERQDVNSLHPNEAKELDAINVFDSSNGLVSHYELRHTYQESPDIPSINNPYIQDLVNIDPTSFKRLFLDKVIRTSNGEEETYDLKYDTQVLPNRHSTELDYWGYYNGKDNGQVLTGTDDRTVDTTRAEAGMLEKITYPTGGSAKFYYEHNKGVMGSEYDDIYLPKINPEVQKTIGLINKDTLVPIGSQPPLEDDVVYEKNGPVKTYEKPFHVNSNNAETDVSEIGIPVGYNPNDFTINIINDDLNEYHSILLTNDITTLYLDAGSYTFEVEVEPPASLSSGHEAVNSMSFTIDDQVNNQDTLFAAGKRIKRIEYLDDNGDVVNKKVYDYNDSGEILGIANFDHNIGTDSFPIVMNYSASFPFSTYQGNTIGYSKVDEIRGDKDENIGRTRYEFLMTHDTGDPTTHPKTPPTDNEWLRGLPYRTTHFKRTNDSYTKVKEIEKKYLVAGEDYADVISTDQLLSDVDGSDIDLTPGSAIHDLDPMTDPVHLNYSKDEHYFKIPFFWIIGISDPFDPDASQDSQKLKTFHFTGGALDVKEVTETLYENGTEHISKTKRYGYNYAEHYQRSSVTTVTSDGVPVTKEYKYPVEMTGVGDAAFQEAIDGLKQQNRLIPIETINYKDHDTDQINETTEITSKQRTIYGDVSDDTSSQGMIKPLTIQASKGNSGLIDKINYHNYDDRGNPLEVSKADGTRIIYVWGYNGGQPIAKIVNATYEGMSSDLENLISQAITDSDDDTDEASEDELRTALDNLRDHPDLQDSQITTYTYDPLIGVTSIKDPRGQTTYYIYGDFNRLEHIEDDDGNIIEEYEYNYKN